MTREESECLTAKISQIISCQTPYVEYSQADAEKFRLNRYGIDGEVYFVIEKLCRQLNITDEQYLKGLYTNAKKLNAEEFENDLYLKNIKVPDITDGGFKLKNMTYARGELLLYDMPDINGELITPKIAFFDRQVSFFGIYEGNIPWMSVCPSEIYSMRRSIEAAHGRVLVLGLGLGYYQYMISLKANVESIVIVELQESVIDLFNRYILPQFENKEKITVIKADAVEYMNTVNKNDFDFCFADIWENQFDGAEPYILISRHEKRLANTEFEYWIGDILKDYVSKL